MSEHSKRYKEHDKFHYRDDPDHNQWSWFARLMDRVHATPPDDPERKALVSTLQGNPPFANYLFCIFGYQAVERLADPKSPYKGLLAGRAMEKTLFERAFRPLIPINENEARTFYESSDQKDVIAALSMAEDVKAFMPDRFNLYADNVVKLLDSYGPFLEMSAFTATGYRLPTDTYALRSREYYLDGFKHGFDRSKGHHAIEKVLDAVIASPALQEHPAIGEAAYKLAKKSGYDLDKAAPVTLQTLSADSTKADAPFFRGLNNLAIASEKVIGVVNRFYVTADTLDDIPALLRHVRDMQKALKARLPSQAEAFAKNIGLESEYCGDITRICGTLAKQFPLHGHLVAQDPYACREFMKECGRLYSDDPQHLLSIVSNVVDAQNGAPASRPPAPRAAPPHAEARLQ